MAKARYDTVISELQAIIVEPREQQDEMKVWDDCWRREDGEAGEEGDEGASLHVRSQYVMLF